VLISLVHMAPRGGGFSDFMDCVDRHKKLATPKDT